VLGLVVQTLVMIMDRDREHLFCMILTYDIVVKMRISLGVGMPSRDFANEDLFSSPMMSMHNSTHSSQINTVGPAMSLAHLVLALATE
jgi:hypothetical protein